MNPVTLDGFTGRIRPCLMASPGESYRAWWFLSYKSCHPALAAPVGQIPLGKSRWANPVGQSTLDEANGFHLRVRHCHFHECPLGKSTRITTSPSFTGHNPLRCLGFTGPSPPRGPVSWGPIRPESQSQSAQPVSTSRTKSTQAQNHQPKPPRESTEFISFFAQALWGLATTFSVGPHSTTSPSSSTRSLSASSDTRAKS